MTNLWTWLRAHPFGSAVIGLGLAGAVYGSVLMFGSTDAETSYVMAAVKRGSIIAAVSGTGQVAAADQVAVTANAAGDLVYLNAVAGEAVAQGAVIGRLEARDAAFELESARLSYEDLVTVDQADLDEAAENLTDAVTEARSALTTTSTALADVLTGIKSLFSGYLNTTNSRSRGEQAKAAGQQARTAYYEAGDRLDEFVKKYRTLETTTPIAEIETLTDEAQRAALAVAQAAKLAQDITVYLRDREDEDATEADEAYTSVTALVAKANEAVATLSETKSALRTNQRTLEDLQAGPDQLEVRSSQLTVRQKEAALADYEIRAPFAGLVASVEGKLGQRVSNGTTIATIISKQQLAEISLNEIDVAKVQAGQPATLTFDAFEDLTLEGEVLGVDLVGTVSQGVVNYTVQIGFTAADERVKPGMTVTAEIVTDQRREVLVVPASAVKSRGDESYVEVLRGETPVAVTVTTGLANDDLVEIVSGLEEGESYIARTTTVSAATTATTPSLFGGSAGSGRAGSSGLMFRR